MSATPTSDVGDPIALVAEDEIALTNEAANVLARIVRQHLDREQEKLGLSVVGHMGGAH